ncbi:MAG TPA: hypothetical protein VLM11_23370 [Streptosporangiaceae bacterium]|nr:hypothetical protein [Streptosporangiaceae bacterium]
MRFGRHRNLTAITRSVGSLQATYNGHPLYSYTGDIARGQKNAHGLNGNGASGTRSPCHEVTVSG